MSFQTMSGSTPIRQIMLIGNSVTADVLEESGFRTLGDIWSVDLNNDNTVRFLIDAADRLTETGRYGGVHFNIILMRAYNRIVKIKDAARMETDVPDELACSITSRYTNDPVRTPNGNLYDRPWIERWIRACGTDPFTRTPLSIDQLTPDHQIKSQTLEYRKAFDLGIIPTRMR